MLEKINQPSPINCAYLSLPPQVRDFIHHAKLTERHSRALLKIDDVSEQIAVLQIISDNKLNVRDSEALIEDRLIPQDISKNIVKHPITIACYQRCANFY